MISEKSPAITSDFTRLSIDSIVFLWQNRQSLDSSLSSDLKWNRLAPNRLILSSELFFQSIQSICFRKSIDYKRFHKVFNRFQSIWKAQNHNSLDVFCPAISICIRNRLTAANRWTVAHVQRFRVTWLVTRFPWCSDVKRFRKVFNRFQFTDSGCQIV